MPSEADLLEQTDGAINRWPRRRLQASVSNKGLSPGTAKGEAKQNLESVTVKAAGTKDMLHSPPLDVTPDEDIPQGI